MILPLHKARQCPRRGPLSRAAAGVLALWFLLSACEPPRDKAQDQVQGQLGWSENFEVTQRDRSNMDGTGANMLWLYGSGELNLALPEAFQPATTFEGVVIDDARQWRGPSPYGGGVCTVTQGVVGPDGPESLEFGGLNAEQARRIRAGDARLLLVFIECQHPEN